MSNIDFGSFLATIGVIGGFITLSVGVSTLVSRRDGKTIQSAKMDATLTSIQSSLEDLRVDVRSGFADTNRWLNYLETSVGELRGRVDMQEKSISRAHERLDELTKGG